MRHSSLAPVLFLALLPTATALSAEAPTRSFDSRFAEARSLALGGKREAALAAYSALLQESPGNSDVLVGRGRVHAWMDHWSEAEADLLEATRASPRYADAWSALGDVYLWSERPQRAVEAYSHWVDIAPTDGEAHVARGKAYRAANSPDAARSEFQAAAALGVDAKGLLASLDTVGTADSLTETAAALAGSRPIEAFIPSRYSWSAGLSMDRVHFHSNGANWIDSVASIRHQGENASVGVEVLESRRFGMKDRAFAVDSYIRLWSRAYANARFQFADDSLMFPHNRWRGELFQGVGKGWELSAAYDRLGFGHAVELISFGAGRYVGNWYLRILHLYVPGTANDPSHSNSDRLTARYYYKGDADHYIEATSGLGRTAATTATNGSTANQDSASFGIAWAGLVTERLGLKLSLNHGYGYESQWSHHDSASAAVYTRW